MKHSLYYFTGTGNSLSIARKVGEKCNMQLTPISTLSDTAEIKGEVIGVVFPIYMYNAPMIIYRFLEKINSCDYFFVIMTLAGRSGNTTKKVRSILRKRGIVLSAGFSVRMPENYLAWHEAIAEERKRQLFNDADKKTEKIREIVTNRATHFDNEDEFNADPKKAFPFPIGYMPRWIIQAYCDMGFSMIPKLDKPFYANNKCNNCEICRKICPVGNITIADKKPVWHHHCEQCFACIQWCPQEAIEYGNKTEGRKRYHHPDITVKDMITSGSGH